MKRNVTSFEGVIGIVKRMKITFTLWSLMVLLCISCIALLTQEVSAQESTNTLLAEPIIETAQLPVTTTAEKPVSTQSSTLSIQTQQRVLNLAANITNQLEATITRLQQITARTGSRVEKMSQENIDTQEASRHIHDADVSLELAVLSLNTIDIQVHEMTTSEAPKESWQIIRSTYVETHEYIRTAHNALTLAVTALKSPQEQSVSTTTDVVE